MSLIEKVIYLADMVEAGRKSYPGIEEIRKLALYDLNKAMHKALQISKDYVENTLKQPVHPITFVLLEEYKTTKNEYEGAKHDT
jgi:HD superfamily phosphohydrolase YqeK